MVDKRTILIVEDKLDNQDAFRKLLVHYDGLPQDKYEFVFADTLVGAMKILVDPARDIAGAILDNGFPLAKGAPRKGKTLGDTGMAPSKEEQAKLDAEGGAGAMVLRFMRSGHTGAMADSSLAEISLQE